MRPNEWQIKLLVGGDRLEISYYIPIIVVFIVLFILLRNQNGGKNRND